MKDQRDEQLLHIIDQVKVKLICNDLLISLEIVVPK